MPAPLEIALIQTSLHWESPEANRLKMEQHIGKIRGAPHLIILPEMFTTGFSMDAPGLAEHMGHKTIDWMHTQAEKTGAVITGSCIVEEDGKYYNRLIWADPEGGFHTYNKKHLFRMAGEHNHYAAGEDRVVMEVKGWKVCPLICYDLRFPEWSRNHYTPEQGLDYDLLVYVANWPAARSIAWDALLQARAVENLSYTAGVNRVGEDGKGIKYNGHSAVYGPMGDQLMYSEYAEGALEIALDFEALEQYRKNFPAYLDAEKRA